MEEKKRCLTGHDADDFGLIGLIIILAIIGIIIFLIVMFVSVLAMVGAGFGGFFSIRNYIKAFKKNVIDSNRAPA